MKKMKKYYLPINSSNLGQYFSGALIFPHKYSVNRVSDFQTLCPNNLILSEYKYFKNADCAVELFFTDNELNKIEKNEEVYLFSGILPITRIIAVYFSDQTTSERVVDFARSSSFIPQRLIQVERKDNKNYFDEGVLDIMEIKSNENLSEKINRFNKYLGGFAFMKLGGENFMNYSKNYFTTLSFFNKEIEKQIKPIQKDLELDYKFYGLFDKKNKEWKDWRKFIFGEIDNIENELKKQDIEFFNNLYSQEDVVENKKLYILSVLANYGVDRPKKADSLILELNKRNLWREEITFFYGLKNGYRHFEKKYFLRNKIYNVKFELKSKLDYYIIESIFSYAFYDKKVGYFNCFENITNEKGVDFNVFKTYKIVDENIIIEKIPSPTDLLEKLKLFVGNIEPYKQIIKDENIDEIVKHTTSIIEKKINVIGEKIISLFDEKEERLKEKEEEVNNLSLLLKKADKNLFDEIDTNGDGKLSQIEIGVFMDKIIEAKNILEEKMKIIGENNQEKLGEIKPIETEKDEIVKIEEFIKSLDDISVAKIAKKYKFVTSQEKYKSRSKEDKLKIIRNIAKEINESKLF